jgi:hypothetical protein
VFLKEGFDVALAFVNHGEGLDVALNAQARAPFAPMVLKFPSRFKASDAPLWASTRHPTPAKIVPSRINLFFKTGQWRRC